MLRVFRQKWLLEEDEMSTIWLAGLIPRDLNEHLEGFWIRNEDMLKKLMTFVDDDIRADVSRGITPIYEVLRRAELDLGRRRRKKRMKIRDIEGLNRANKVKETILSARLVSENLMSRHIQPIHPSVRRRAKDAFFSMLACENQVEDVSDINEMRPQHITHSVRAARYVDRKPCSLGTSSRLPECSMQRLRASRYLGVNYRDRPSEAEEEILNLDDEEFERQLLLMERAPKYQGFSFKSPSGKPFTRIIDNKIMKRPAVFDFSVDLEQVPRIKQPFTWKGRNIRRFKPCFYGGDTLTVISRSFNKKWDKLAFGHGLVDGVHKVFFKGNKRTDEIRTIDVTRFHINQRVNYHRLSDCSVYFVLRFDNTPIQTYMHSAQLTARLPGILGDDTAIQNYGNYCRSSSPDGFKIYQSVFEHFKSSLPHHVINNMPSYPYFAGEIVTLERGRHTTLTGYSAICRLKLVSSDSPADIVHIDLNQREPMIKQQTIHEDMIDLEYD